MSKRILDLIMEYAVNERLDAIIFRDQEFMSLQKKLDEQIEAFDSLGLSKEERQAVDQLISAHTESEAYYSAAAYRLGFKDCAAFLCEIGLVGKGCGRESRINRKPQGKEGKGGSGLTDRFCREIQKIVKRRRDKTAWILRNSHRKSRRF